MGQPHSPCPNIAGRLQQLGIADALYKWPRTVRAQFFASPADDLLPGRGRVGRPR